MFSAKLAAARLTSSYQPGLALEIEDNEFQLFASAMKAKQGLERFLGRATAEPSNKIFCPRGEP
jgi:hypothetical protein